HDIARRAAGPGQDDGQRGGRRQHALQRRLVLVHERAALHAHAPGGERRHHRGGVVVDERQRRPDGHEAHAGGHSHPKCRATRSSASAYTRAMRSSIMTPTPPRMRCETLAGNGLITSNTRKSTNPARSTAGVGGTTSTDSGMPATSSTTITPGSFVASERSASPAAQVPTAVTATSTTVSAGGE